MKLIYKDMKYCKELEPCKVYCKCGHSIIFPVYDEYKICSHCGRKVKNTSKTRFRYLLLKERNKINED